MSYKVSETRDLGLLVQLFHSIRAQRQTRERFEWLYANNPAGKARAWVLSDSCGRPVGFTACYPREVWVDGRLCQALNCGDFSIDLNHRTLGPAIMLRRPAKMLVDSGEFAFLYAHPLPAMLPVHIRVGHRQLSAMTRWVYPIKVDALLGSKLGRGLAWPVGSAANLALKLRRGLQGVHATRFKIHEAETFSQDLDALDWLLSQRYRVVGRRTRAHLVWRFIENPGLNVAVVEARDSGGMLVGYLVLELSTPTSKVHDLACLPRLGVERALLLYAARRAAEVGATTLSFEVQRSFPATSDLRRFGFWERAEPKPTVCYAGKTFWGKACVEEERNWLMTIEDRDV